MTERERRRRLLLDFGCYVLGVVALTPLLVWVLGDSWDKAESFAIGSCSAFVVLTVYRFFRPRRPARPSDHVDGGMLGWRTSDD